MKINISDRSYRLLLNVCLIAAGTCALVATLFPSFGFITTIIALAVGFMVIFTYFFKNPIDKK